MGKADDDFVFALDLDEFAHKAFEGAFADGYGFAFGEIFEYEFDGFLGKIAHEAEAFDLVVGDDNGFAEFADKGDGAVGLEYVAEFGIEDVNEDVSVNNWDYDFFDAIAPFALDSLEGQIVFNPGFSKAFTDFFFGAGCGVQGVPVFLVGLHGRLRFFHQRYE